MKRFQRLIGLLVGGSLPLVMAMGQTPVNLSYADYMQRVAQDNVGYAAEKLNVPAAQAEVTAAKVFNDPNLSVSYYNNENNSLQMGEGVEVELSKTFSFGKRGANIALAKSEQALAEALLADYLRNLRADATLAYLEALRQRQLFQVKQRTFESIDQLATSDSIRHQLGEIGEVDAIQSRVEAEVIRNEMVQTQAELYKALSQLSVQTGSFSTDTLFLPEGELQLLELNFVLADLLNEALLQRADLVAALQDKEVAAKALKVARRERNTDVDLSVTVSRNARVHNEEAPAPPFTGVSAGIAIPLKLSNFNKGTVRAARFRAQQAELRYEEARLQVQTEVMQAFWTYELSRKQVAQYDNGLLRQAEAVMEGKRYSYQRGEASLIEVLDAQRTYDDVQAQYIETLFNYSSALVELERSAGQWNIQLQP